MLKPIQVDDGKVSLRISPLVIIGDRALIHGIRFYDKIVALDSIEAYSGVSTMIERPNNEVEAQLTCTLKGFSITRRHMFLLCQWFISEGYERFLSLREKGHSFPLSTLRESDNFMVADIHNYYEKEVRHYEKLSLKVV